MNSMKEIKKLNPVLAYKIQQQEYFLREDDIAPLVLSHRLMPVLVRCGNGRFTCPVQDLQHFISIIEEHSKLSKDKSNTDYVRDISIPI